MRQPSARWSIVAALVGALLVALAGPASADRRVFLNGVDLGDVDVRGQSFDGCKVRFDAQGNIHITVKGFEIRKAPVPDAREPKRAKRGAPVARVKKANYGKTEDRFYLVAQQTKNPAPYQVSVYINGKRVKVIGPSNPTVVVDVSRFLGPGRNEIRFSAVRLSDTPAQRAQRSPNDEVEIVLGEGEIEKGTVIIRVPHIEYKRNASETKYFDTKYHLDAR